MKKFLKTFLIKISLFGTIFHGSAQMKVTEFNYTYQEFNTCNAFATPQNFGGYEHKSNFGKVGYTGEDEFALKFPFGAHSFNAFVYGSQFSIAYPFKKDHKYTVKANSRGHNANVGVIAFGLSVDDPGSQPSEICTSGVTAPVESTVYVGAYGKGVQGTTYAWSAPLIDGVIQQNYNYLLVAGFPNNNYTGTQVDYVYLQKIEIQETPPFTLSSSPTSIGCGQQTPVTFTVTNNSNLDDVTSYIWNLGSGVNGWKYNGADAPSSITTTSPSLSLTSAGLTTAANPVSVTVYINTTPYNTYTTPISFTPPTGMSITGSGLLCTTSDYSIANFPAGATVSWSVFPEDFAEVSGSGGNAQLTAMVGQGEVTLKATITACGSTSVIEKTGIIIGPPSPVYSITMEGVNPETSQVCHYSESVLLANPQDANGIDLYEWHLPYDWTALTNTTTPDYMLPVNPGGDGTVAVRKLNACGYSDMYFVNVSFDPWCGYNYNIGPNPATSTITVDGQENKKNINEVQILDKTGQVKRVFKYGKNLQRVTVNLSGLKPDVYYIKIFDGKEWRSKPIRVQ